MSVETRRKQREPKTETEKALMAQKAKEGLQGLAIGPVTGLLGLPSDIIDLADMANDAIAKYGKDTTIAQFSKLIKPQLDAVQEKYGRDAFDKGFTELTGIKSDPARPAQFLGELVSLGTLAKGAKTGAKVIGETISDTYKGAKKLFDDSTLPPPDNLALETAGETKPVGQLDQTKKLLDKTKTTKPIETGVNIIPESEFKNAKPTINPIFAGEGTETGKKQAAKFRELEAQNKYTPEELFLQTRVYRGDDGQLRWEISTADAKLKSSWEKSLNFEDEFLGITVPEKADGYYDNRASMQLGQIIDFPTAFKEYYDVKRVPKYFDDVQTKTKEVMSETELSALRNLQVYWERGDRYSNTLGYYTPNRDRITLNVRQLKAAARQTAEDYGIPFEEAFKLQVESTLLHEVQHAVQLREGFRMGGDSDNFLPENFDALVSTNRDKKDRILLDVDDQFEVAIEEMAKKDPSYNTLAIRNKILNEVNSDFNTLYDVLVHKETNSIDKYKNKSVKELDSLYKQADERLNNKFSTFKDYIYSQDRDRMKLGLFKNAQENVKLKNLDTEATNKYYNLYGEREARLVQKRLEDRFKLKKLGGAEVAKEVESDTKFLSPKGDTDTRGRKLGKMGGFPADTKITPTKLMADGTTFHSSIIEFPQNPSKAKRKFDLEKIKIRQEKARKLEDEQLKIQNIKIAEAHAPMVKLLGAEETTKVANNPPTLNADGTGFTEKSLVFKNLSDRYTEEALSVVNPEITWIRIPEIYKQKPFQKYKDGDVLRNAEGKTVKIELTSFLPVTDKKLYNNPNVVNVSALGKNINKKQYHVEPTYILGDGKYVRLTDLERVGYKKVGKPSLSLISDTKKMNKGGDMNKQMDLFQEGGLKDEGGTVDPVSGNDVPPGSTQEEVRDDIPAQLSEGEFVFPADVVRYIGLEKLMRLRQEAKQGLKKMEDMGQMGNTDEATIPDDLPFDETDLDMEDEEEYNNDTQEMNQGGVIQAQTGTFVAPGAGVTTMPSQFAGQQLPSAGTTPSYTVPNIPPPTPAPVGGFTPIMSGQVGQQPTAVTPTFQSLIGRTPGQYDEFREYTNEAGMKLQIPFKDGQPIYPIPEGYTYVDPEEIKTEEVTTKQVTPTTTRVTEQDGGDASDTTTTSAVDLVGDPYSYKSMFDMDALDKTMKDISFSQLNLFDPKDAISRGIGGNINVGNIILDAQRQVMEGYKKELPNEGKGYNLVNLPQAGRDILAERLNKVKQRYEDVLTDNKGKDLSIQGLVDKYNRIGKGTQGFDRSLTMKDMYVKGTNIIDKNVVKQIVVNIALAAKKEKEAAKQVKEMETSPQGQDTFGKGVGDPLGLDFGSSYEEGESDDTGTDVGGGETSFVGDDPAFQQGGLLKKKKPKVKKMKRGGLASKK